MAMIPDRIAICRWIFLAFLTLGSAFFPVGSAFLSDPTPEFEGRIHLEAPAGVGVTPHPDLRRFLDNFPTCIPTVMPITNDSAYFEWDFKRQIIQNRLPVDRKLGQYYEIWMRLICLTGEFHDFRVKIGASDVNELAPNFQRRFYDFYVFKNRHKGDEIGRIFAKDDDIVIYNAMLDFFATNDTFNFVNVTQKGLVVLERDLCEIQRDLPAGNQTKFYAVEVKACDYGSPQKCDTAILRMHIVGMTGNFSLKYL